MTDCPPGPDTAGARAAPSGPRRSAGWAAAVLLGLAVLHTWPLASDPNRLSRHNDDEWLNAWALSWIAHQLPRDPLDLFGANMFHPAADALAYTEPLLVPGLMGAPLRWAGATPMATYNLLVLAGLTLTGLAMYWLVVAWTGDPWAGLLAGAVVAFSTALLTRISHLQILHLYPLPLALLSLDRLLRHGRTRDAVRLAACVLCAALTSGYLAVFVAAALGSSLLARARGLWSRHGAAVLLRLSAAAVVTLASLYVLLRPYLALQVPRPPPADADDIGSALLSYLSTAADLHYELWSHAVFDRAPRALFPGVVAIALAGGALLTRSCAPRGVRRMLLAVAGGGLLLSLGSLTPAYEWFSFLVPPVQSLRAPSRFGTLVVFAVGGLAGLGLAAFRRAVSPRWGVAGAVGLVAAATAESLHAPIPYRPVDWNPPIHRALAAVDPGPVVELPLYSGGRFNRNAWYLLASTSHWRPLVAGFGNSRPRGFDDRARVAASFPSVLAVARLEALGVTHVVVHVSRYPPASGMRADLADLGGRSDVVLVAEAGPDRLYRIRGAAASGGSHGLAGLPWPELRLFTAPGDGSYLHGYEGGYGFSLQSAERFIAYLEDTAADSHLRLRLPVRMTGRFLDALTGRDLGPVAVPAASGGQAAMRIAVPAGRRVIVSLRATEPTSPGRP